jgi:hypothetical protein
MRAGSLRQDHGGMGQVINLIVCSTDPSLSKLNYGRYCNEEEGWPGASVDNLASLEYFLYLKGKSIDGINDLNPGLNSILTYMRDFTAAYKRKYNAIPSDIMESMRSVCESL